MFSRKNRDKGATIEQAARTVLSESLAPQRRTLLDRLEEQRREKEIALVASEQQLIDLDAQIAWLKRHPEAEKILEALQKRCE